MQISQMAEEIIREAEALRRGKPRIAVAIDGRCAAGKTTLAAQLRGACGCEVIHMDDFFLRPEQRTPQRLAEPDGNIDYERFLAEVLLPLEAGEPFSFRRYDCHAQALRETVSVLPQPLTVIEGSYSCHAALREHYDLRVFLDIGSEEQLRRLRERCDKAGFRRFCELWIPLEERYFETCHIEERCDLRFRADA